MSSFVNKVALAGAVDPGILSSFLRFSIFTTVSARCLNVIWSGTGSASTYPHAKSLTAWSTACWTTLRSLSALDGRWLLSEALDGKFDHFGTSWRTFARSSFSPSVALFHKYSNSDGSSTCCSSQLKPVGAGPSKGGSSTTGDSLSSSSKWNAASAAGADRVKAGTSMPHAIAKQKSHT